MKLSAASSDIHDRVDAKTGQPFVVPPFFCHDHTSVLTPPVTVQILSLRLPSCAVRKCYLHFIDGAEKSLTLI